ncbi:hypothetical protein [Kitasatospora sp. KL5]|uniref:hypothetical protein n=1 Tax=Kitasatospora sp. KL5 TaxID=3425125 RepID=UPI003D6E56DE
MTHAPDDVFHDFADELADAGQEAVKRRMLLLLDSAMASDDAASALADRDVAWLLLAVQNGLVFDAATELSFYGRPSSRTGTGDIDTVYHLVLPY